MDFLTDCDKGCIRARCDLVVRKPEAEKTRAPSTSQLPNLKWVVSRVHHRRQFGSQDLE